jgi:Holliday junction DNA helicase RuvA
MIGYLEGTLLKKDDDRILLLANQVGYEVLLPAVVMESLNTKQIDEKISLYIYFHQTERQPKPVLIGFNLEIEKDFFQHFISVEAIGPLKAVKALDSPISDIARAIESRDVSRLKMLKGIGARLAHNIIATLEG